MSDQHLDPAKSVIAKIGIAKVCEITGKHVSRVYRWMYAKEKGGTGGFIPQEEAEQLLAHAEANGIDLTPADFFRTRQPSPVPAEEPTEAAA